MDAVNADGYEPDVMKLIQLVFLSVGIVATAVAAHPVLASARRALDERIPEVALEAVSRAIGTLGFPAEDTDGAKLLMAEAQLRLGKSDDALAVLTPMTGKAATLLRAHALASARRWNEALPFYEELGDVPVSAAVGRAEALQMLGRRAEAVAVLGKLIGSGNAPVSVRLRHAGLLAELGRKSEVETLMREIKPETPADEKWRDYVKARLLLNEEPYTQALDALNAVIAKPEGVTPNLLAAVVLAATEARLKISSADTDEAARELERFLQNNPDNPAIEMVFRRLDQVNSGARNPRERELHKMALEHAEPALKFRAALAQFYVCKMQLREKNRRQLAGQSIASFIEWHSSHRLATFVWEMKAELDQSNGEFDSALEALEAAQRTTQDKERKALLEMRMGLVSFQKGDPSLAVTYFQLASEGAQRLKNGAAFNAALAELGRKNFDGFQTRLAGFIASNGGDPLAGELLLEAGFTKARENDSDAPAALRAFLARFPTHERAGEAHLALAELSLASGNVAQVNVEIDNARALESGNKSGAQAERNHYAQIFAADAANPRDEKAVEKIIALARSFISSHPKSALLPDVRMKLGQVYFHEQDFVNAQVQFETLANENPDGDYAEPALFLAGQCAGKLSNAERAKKLFDQVVERKGPLKHHARFQQGLIEHELNNDASAIFQTILDAQPPASAELRYATFCAIGDNLVRVAKDSPSKLGSALTAYTQLAAIPDIPAEWHNQAVYKKAKVLMQLGQAQEALEFLNALIDSAATTETFWLYKAGFEAASMLEGQGSWRSAIAIYEKLEKIPGPRAEESRGKAKELRLKKFIWD